MKDFKIKDIESMKLKTQFLGALLLLIAIFSPVNGQTKKWHNRPFSQLKGTLGKYPISMHFDGYTGYYFYDKYLEPIFIDLDGDENRKNKTPQYK